MFYAHKTIFLAHKNPSSIYDKHTYSMVLQMGKDGNGVDTLYTRTLEIGTDPKKRWEDEIMQGYLAQSLGKGQGGLCPEVN